MSAKISVKDLKKSFDTDQGPLPVVNGVSFDVADGEFVAIVGLSGCGKSTLMSIIAGFDRPDQGSVTVDGAAGKGPSSKGILISQQGSVFPWLNVQQNLMFGLNDHAPSDKEEIADHYAAIVGLKGFEKSYPHELSGGMLKRVELARALVVKPEILYMDEPFSALDALMSHDVEEALQLADRIFVLSVRPTKIQATFEVSFAHPRKLSSPEVQDIKESILRELG